MTGSPAVPRILYGAAAGIALAGVAFWVVPVGAGAPSAGEDPAAGMSVESIAIPEADTARAGIILKGNVLSSARRPPRSRIRSAGTSDTARGPGSRPQAAAFQPRLFGTVTGSEGSALIDADPKVPGAELYRTGDRLLGRRLTEISDSNVVLEGPSGRLVLRLERTRGPSR